jgi:hypothetical protein
VRSPNREAPHNLYGSTDGVRIIARRNGWERTQPFSWLPYKVDAPLGQHGPGKTISITFSSARIGSSPEYDVQYDFDRVHNDYRRSVGHVLAIDRLTGRQLTAKNVVVLFADMALIPGDPEQRITVRSIGGGRAMFFRDGHSLHGRWQKRSMLDTLHFWDNRGRQLALDPGVTWIEVVPPGSVRVGSK